MHPLRRGLAQRLIVLLLAAAMPLCCCLVKGVTTVSDDGVPIAAVATCCCDNAQDCGEEQTSGQDGCGACCCAKAPATLDDWTPPIDDIGTLLPLTVIQWTIDRQCEHRLAAALPTGKAPPGPWSISAPPLRHATILQV